MIIDKILRFLGLRTSAPLEKGPVWDDPELERVLPALAAGDLAAGLALLRASVDDPALRSVRVEVLSDAALPRIEALAGLAADGDADVLLWLGSARVRAAWEIRGASRARYVGEERFRRFWAALEGAAEPLMLAARLRPEDPEPWNCLQWFGLGMQLPREDLDRMWMELCSRDSQHVSGHFSRTQVLCPKWQGSHEELFRFARDTVAMAGPGDPRLGVLAVAHFENLGGELGDVDIRPVDFARQYYSDPDVAAELARTADRWLQVPTQHPLAGMPAHYLGASAYYGGDEGRARFLLSRAGARVPEWSPWSLEYHDERVSYRRARQRLGLAPAV
ncbi:hypothetical protein [Nocardiopsis sp. LOL_012]|uniref:hypothetical protein n=1 Tax=Nocardiopsis sp. LOL_012 TaxID=3345409 RepID=UPI003A86DA4E